MIHIVLQQQGNHVKINVLTTAAIDSMISRAAFHEFPFLKNPPRLPDRRSSRHRAAKGCGSCGKRRRAAAQKKLPPAPVNYNAIKALVAGLSFQRAEVMKKLLGWDGIRLNYRDHKGKICKRVV